MERHLPPMSFVKRFESVHSGPLKLGPNEPVEQFWSNPVDIFGQDNSRVALGKDIELVGKVAFYDRRFGSGNSLAGVFPLKVHELQSLIIGRCAIGPVKISRQLAASEDEKGATGRSRCHSDS